MKPSFPEPIIPSNEESLAYYTDLATRWEIAACKFADRETDDGCFPTLNDANRIKAMFEVADMLISRVAHLEKTGGIQ